MLQDQYVYYNILVPNRSFLTISEVICSSISESWPKSSSEKSVTIIICMLSDFQNRNRHTTDVKISHVYECVDL